MTKKHHHQQHKYDQNKAPLSGSVRVRKEHSKNSLPKVSGRSLQNGAVAEYEHPQVLCFVACNWRGCFNILMTTNNFGGMPMSHVLLDSEHSSLLSPFPLQNERVLGLGGVFVVGYWWNTVSLFENQALH